MNPIRLSYEELIYLCVSLAQAKEIYGLTPKSMEERIDWEVVRKGLIESGRLKEDSEHLLIEPRLAYAIHAIGRPKKFVSVRKSTDVQTNCFYFARHLAVGMTKVVTGNIFAPDEYLLSIYTSYEAVCKALSGIMCWESGEYSPRAERALFDLERYEMYLQAVRYGDWKTHKEMLAAQEFSEECIQDVYDAFYQRKEWRSIILLSFDPEDSGSGHIVEQSVIYTGAKYLWNMEISPTGAQIQCTGKEEMERKLESISNLFRYL